MNNSGPVPSQYLEPAHLHDLLRHVDAEEISLRNTLRLLQVIPAMSQSSDEAERRDMRLRIEQSLQHAALLSQNRLRVMLALARFLSIPVADVSFSALLPYSSAAAIQLLIPARRRLQSLVRQVSALVQSVSWVINESQRIYLTVFESLPGTAPSSNRYDASGQKNLNPALFRFETRS
ncbi:MAG: hypothetical protein NTX48_10615 [Planctomycetales bacterium]|nr:hypothetical protein [Planctomycetales bacterium]